MNSTISRGNSSLLKTVEPGTPRDDKLKGNIELIFDVAGSQQASDRDLDKAHEAITQFAENVKNSGDQLSLELLLNLAALPDNKSAAISTARELQEHAVAELLLLVAKNDSTDNVKRQVRDSVRELLFSASPESALTPSRNENRTDNTDWRNSFFQDRAALQRNYMLVATALGHADKSKEDNSLDNYTAHVEEAYKNLDKEQYKPRWWVENVTSKGTVIPNSQQFTDKDYNIQKLDVKDDGSCQFRAILAINGPEYNLDYIKTKSKQEIAKELETKYKDTLLKAISLAIEKFIELRADNFDNASFSIDACAVNLYNHHIANEDFTLYASDRVKESVNQTENGFPEGFLAYKDKEDKKNKDKDPAALLCDAISTSINQAFGVYTQHDVRDPGKPYLYKSPSSNHFDLCIPEP